MNASLLTISVPPFGRSLRFVFSAAGFIATSTFGESPGVRMSWSAKWSWKPETPGSEPAGARISAGKSGSVEMSLPSSAVSEVNCAPVSCMPSPESPAKRTITWESCSTGLATASHRYSESVRGRGPGPPAQASASSASRSTGRVNIVGLPSASSGHSSRGLS